MILADTGPLVALLDAGETDHDRCRAVLDDIILPLLTTWPVFTEAMYLLGRAAGFRAQAGLWQMPIRGHLVLADLPRPTWERAFKLMEHYADRPMGLADATLVALAEERGLRRVFSLDADFHIYRAREHSFEVIPGPPVR